MLLMIPGIEYLAIPLGYILWLIYGVIRNYFVSIFLFTLVVRAATFPLSLKSQKMQADRAKLAPRLERLQKKYGQDKKKFQEKQMALYEKEGVSLTGGCLPTIVQMVVLFGIIAVIYSPLTHLSRIPEKVIGASLTAVAQKTEKGEDDKDIEIADTNKLPAKIRTGVYKELNLLKVLKPNESEIIKSIDQLSAADRKNISGKKYFERMEHVSRDFNFFGKSLLDSPWSEKQFAGINILWLIPLLSWLTAFASSYISMKFMKQTQAGQDQPGQGCQNNTMLLVMPLFSLFITFTVPGGVGIYWISSNIIAVGQSIILNRIYNPAKIRAQAEVEYQERRRRKLEDKKRLAEARARENAELNALNQAEGTNKGSKKKTGAKKPPATKQEKPEPPGDEGTSQEE
ncbi:MAG: YidC/Oxa1 family membrane protein insertase [Oscillospiraceae bacterium]|nr:YidC/Oxa1 family membrane protein insertase [Oscillospiraceae bacterium]MDD3832549.1 YidC/Oxa1 family membrane protein insertase [Oscillospiraceae bacterium]MDD4545756.1 YidC/Oxa1 family membrane protein insertase [Oscillospiraceae bacterium]